MTERRIFDFRFSIFDRRNSPSIQNPNSWIQSHVLRLHGDERGTISVLSLATIIGLMMLMGMVINIGRHIDDKVRMQNAVDASAYSGGVVLARGMNALAFSNHLLCDVFALTAYLREARDRNAERLTPEILDAWASLGPIFEKGPPPKFVSLGRAIPQKVKQERELVRSFSELSAEISKLVLPVLEYVLRERLIPEFERAVVQSIPRLAQDGTNEIARRHGLSRSAQMREQQSRGPQVGILWRTNGLPVGYPDETDPMSRTLPVFDPTPMPGLRPPRSREVADPNPDPDEGSDARMMPNGDQFLLKAFTEREHFARTYLEQWTSDRLRFFETEAKMSQFINLWRIFTCGQLTRLLYDEYPESNLPHLLRPTDTGLDPLVLRRNQMVAEQNAYLDRNFMFVGIAYRRKFLETSGRMYKNPLDADPLTFAQITLMAPRRRLVLQTAGGIAAGGSGNGLDGSGNAGGGAMGPDVTVPPAPGNAGSPVGGAPPQSNTWVSDGSPDRWDLWNQGWIAQLVPATTDSLAGLLQSKPPDGAVNVGQPMIVKLPNLGGTSSRDIRRINTH
jgi:hypothetical protein